MHNNAWNIMHRIYRIAYNAIVLFKANLAKAKSHLLKLFLRGLRKARVMFEVRGSQNSIFDYKHNISVAHAKFQEPRITPSGKKSESEEKNLGDSLFGHYILSFFSEKNCLK